MAGLSLERDTEVPINGNSKPIALLKTGDTKLSDVEKKDTIDDDGDEGNLKPAAVVANPDGAGNQPTLLPRNMLGYVIFARRPSFVHVKRRRYTKELVLISNFLATSMSSMRVSVY
jgi:hypothetical protein